MRIRVARSDWWASRNVVSVTGTSRALAQLPGEAGRPELEEEVAGAGGVGARRVEVGKLQARDDVGAGRDRWAG